MSYIDQLARSNALSVADISELTNTIEIAESSLEAGRGDRTTAAELRDLADDLNPRRLSDGDAAKVSALKGTLEQLADRL